MSTMGILASYLQRTMDFLYKKQTINLINGGVYDIQAKQNRSHATDH